MKKILYLLLLLPVLAGAQPAIHISASADTICAGRNVDFGATFSGLISPHYKWLANGIHEGRDTLFYSEDSLSNGAIVLCELTNSTGDTIFATSNSIIMTVHPMPDAGIITGSDSSVCIGSVITLYDSAPGGSWSAENDYVTVSGGVVTGVYSVDGPPPTDMIYYSVSNQWCSDTAERLIHVRPLPDGSFTIGPSVTNILCMGHSYLINDGDGVNGTLTSTHGTIEYGFFNGVYSVNTLHMGYDLLVSIDSNSCGVDTFRKPITVIGPPDSAILSRSNNICVGDTVTLFDTTATSEQIWSASNNTAAINSSGIVTGISTGIDTIHLNIFNQCGNAKSSAVITINPVPAPITGPDSIYKGQSVTLGNVSAGGQWSTGSANTVSVNSSTGSVTGIGNGIAAIRYTLPSGCFDTANITVTTLKNDVVISPGPFGSTLTIHCYVDQYHSCVVFNSIGQVILNQSLTNPVTTINTASLAAGIYVVHLEGSKDYISKIFRK